MEDNMSEEHNEDYAASEDMQAMEEAPVQEETLEETDDDVDRFEEDADSTPYDEALKSGAEPSSRPGVFFEDEGKDKIFTQDYLPPSKRQALLEKAEQARQALIEQGEFERANAIQQNLEYFERLRQNILAARKANREAFKSAKEASASNSGDSREHWNTVLAQMGVIPRDEAEEAEGRARAARQSEIKKAVEESDQHNYNRLMRLLGD
jgi:hypothetical protein